MFRHLDDAHLFFGQPDNQIGNVDRPVIAIGVQTGAIDVFIMLKNPRLAKDLKWDDEPVAATVPEVVAGKSSIVLVIHDFGHGGWQFLDGEDVKGRKPAVIRKVELLQLDPSVAELKDLPAGWRARRSSSK